MANCCTLLAPPRLVTSIDHVRYPKSLRDKPVESLRFIIRDCREAIAANPEGDKAGYYADEIHYAAAELRRRGIQ